MYCEVTLSFCKFFLWVRDFVLAWLAFGPSAITLSAAWPLNFGSNCLELADC